VLLKKACRDRHANDWDGRAGSVLHQRVTQHGRRAATSYKAPEQQVRAIAVEEISHTQTE